MSKYPIGHYVYRLIDPQNDLPFYVGKGQAGRAWSHEAAVRAGTAIANARKVAKILEIIQRGDVVTVDIVAVYDTAAEALDHEFRLVDEDPTLTNVLPGGISAEISPAYAARRAAARQRLLMRARKRDFTDMADRERAKRRAAKIAEGRTPRDRAQIAAWLDGLSEREAAKVLAPLATAVKQRYEAKIRKHGRPGAMPRPMTQDGRRLWEMRETLRDFGQN